MDKMQLASELRTLAERLVSLADGLAGDAPAPELSHADVRKVLAEKSRAGHTAKIKELLIAHGAEKLSEIDPKEYAALVKEVEVL